MSRPIFHHLFHQSIRFFVLPLLLLHTTASFVSDVYRNMLKYVNYAKVIYKAILIAMGEGGILLAEKSNKTNTSEKQKKKKVQTQHAWLIRDNAGAPIALNIRINQWRFNFSTGVRTIAIWWTVFFPHRLLTSVMNVSKEIKNTKFGMIERLKLHWISYKFSIWSLPTLSHPILQKKIIFGYSYPFAQVL